MRSHALLPLLIVPLAAACAAQPAPEAAAPKPVVIDVDEDAKTGKRAKGDEGKMSQAERDRQIAANAGILGLLKEQGELDAVFGSSGLDADTEDALGGLIGAPIGEAYGAGGLGLKGIGRGGGGTGEGIGLGSIGTIGHGAGTGTGYGRGAGRLGRGGKQPPRVRMGAVTTDVGLPREIVRRIVRQHFAELRFCYEKRLQKDPNLAGRVVVAFTVAKDGTVSAAKAAESTGDKALDGCAVKVFEGMVFPKPKGGGVVKVKYPVVFAPGSSSATKPKSGGGGTSGGGGKKAPAKAPPSPGPAPTP